VKKESKESEGNPEIKAKIRQQQREMARRRMMSQIPQADVVITNPTHYAVAVKYQDEGMHAPIVIAKGADAVALKIREIAAEHHIVTLESPKVLAYVFQLRVYQAKGGYNPQVPSVLPVPDELDPHSLLPAPNFMGSGNSMNTEVTA